MTFWSRSRQEYWRKGDTSGNVQYVRGAALDCDGDTLLVRSTRSARPATPARTPASTSTRSSRVVRRHAADATARPPAPSSTRAIAAGHRVVPVLRELFADGETPIGVYRKLALRQARARFLLESAEQGGIWSRCSFVGVAVARRAHAAATARPRWLDYGLPAERALGADAPDGAARGARAPLRSAGARRSVAGHPPLTGGLVGFIGWEAVRQLERLPDSPPADFAVPGPGAELRLRARRRSTTARAPSILIATVLNDGADDADALWARRAGRLDALQARPRAARPRRGSREVDLDVAPSPTRAHRARRTTSRPIERVEAVHPRRRRVPGRHLAALRPRAHGRARSTSTGCCAR